MFYVENISVLEVKKNEKVYKLHLPNNTNLGELHDVLFEMREIVVSKINEILASQKPAEKVEPCATESPIETKEV